MSRGSRFTAALAAGLVAAAVCTAPAAAQTSAIASISAVANVSGIAPLTAAGVNDLNFGLVNAGTPKTPTSLANDAGRFNISGQPTKLTPVEPLRFLADSRVNDALPLVFDRDGAGRVTGFTLGIQKFTRVPPNAPEIPPEWRAYLGSYGPSFIPLVVSARHGHLYAMTENVADYRLTPVNRHLFAFPPGLYVDEHLVFLTDRSGKPHSVDLANMVLRRR